MTLPAERPFAQPSSVSQTHRSPELYCSHRDSRCPERMPNPGPVAMAQPTQPSGVINSKDKPQEYSLAHLTLLSKSPPELIEIAARTGYAFVGLRLIPVGVPGEPLHRLDTNPALLRQTKAALCAAGIGVLDVEIAKICDGVDMRSYLPALTVGAELGARHVLTSVWTTDITAARAQLLQLWELMQPLGLTVDLEFMPFSEVRTLSEAVALLRSSGAPIGLCIDTLHFDLAGCVPEELAAVPPTWFHYAQICDGPAASSRAGVDLRHIARQARLFLGEGGIDVRAILARLPAMPYSIELPNAHWLARLGPEQFARRCLTSAKRYLASHAVPESIETKDSNG